ncbi:MAG: peptide deformylase [Acidobacteriota bacterium]|nr:peptide deformylase [Acidobacteriota bacterium]
MALLPIRIFPDPVLRVKCPPVERFDEELQQLVKDMTQTMHEAPGVGLAAPQVGIEQRLALVDLSVGEDPEQLFVFVNPVILEEDGKDTAVEGCLSIPNITDKVTRPYRIKVAAQNLEGEAFEMEAEDWLARAICHEVDHLDGVLFVDYLRGLRRERVKRQLKKLSRQPQEVSR